MDLCDVRKEDFVDFKSQGVADSCINGNNFVNISFQMGLGSNSNSPEAT